MRMRLFSAIAVLAAACCGCGTLVPGPRPSVIVDDAAFSGNGTGVLYLADDFRFNLLLRRFRRRRYLYLYDIASRRHRFLARTDSFSASPFGPFVLYAPEWVERSKKPGEVPDFYLLDLENGTRRGFHMPADFDKRYLDYGFEDVLWERNGSLTAFVGFRYGRGRPRDDWVKIGSDPVDWRTRLWKVRIDPGRKGDGVASAEPWSRDRLPDVPWVEKRRLKFVSPDGTSTLRARKFGGYVAFGSDLVVVKGDDEIYVVKDCMAVDLARAGKFIVYSILGAPLNLLDTYLP